jgi:prophage antirepressor-like protein
LSSRAPEIAAHLVREWLTSEVGAEVREQPPA